MAAMKPFVSRVKEAMFHTCPGEPPHRDTFLAMPMHAVCEGCAAAEAEKLEARDDQLHDLRVAYDRLGVVGPYSAGVFDHRVKAQDVISERPDDVVRLLSERPYALHDLLVAIERLLELAR